MSLGQSRAPCDAPVYCHTSCYRSEIVSRLFTDENRRRQIPRQSTEEAVTTVNERRFSPNDHVLSLSLPLIDLNVVEVWFGPSTESGHVQFSSVCFHQSSSPYFQIPEAGRVRFSRPLFVSLFVFGQ